MTGLVSLGVILVVLSVLAYFVIRIRGNDEILDGSPMTIGQRRVLIGYLLLLGTLLVYMLISLNSIDFPETALLPEPVPTPTATPTPTPGQQAAAGETSSPTPTPSPSPSPSPTAPQPPALYRVFPQTSTSSPPTVALTLYGQNFTEKSTVRFNTKRVQPTFISETLLSAQLEPAHLAKVGAVTVDVENNGLLSNAITVPVTRPKVPLNVFGFEPLITREVQLLLLVICAGALGSYFHALKSLGDFIGNRTAIASWFWWYITRPFLGMALALVFYAVLRGGFLIGSPADERVVNPFGVFAIAALVGMFADKAAQKLAEIFDVVFKVPDQRSGKLEAPVIGRLEPSTVRIGETTPVTLKIIGDRLGKVVTVRLNSEDRKPDTISEKEITLKLKPEDFRTAAQIKVTVVNPDGGVSAAATVHVSDLAIANTTLPNAPVDTDYSVTMTASGGTPPYKWSLVTAPSWLSIEENTGNLKGKPAAGDLGNKQVTVKVVDKNGAAVAKNLPLQVL